MTLATPCDVCRQPLRREVTTVRFLTGTLSPAAPGHARLIPSSRPEEFLLCVACAAYVQACVDTLEEHRGVPAVAPR